MNSIPLAASEAEVLSPETASGGTACKLDESHI